MDPIAFFIATLHQMLGHAKTAAVLGQPPGDLSTCVLCNYEREPTEEKRAAVIAALNPPAT